jgi:hypothetical protein
MYNSHYRITTNSPDKEAIKLNCALLVVPKGREELPTLRKAAPFSHINTLLCSLVTMRWTLNLSQERSLVTLRKEENFII